MDTRKMWKRLPIALGMLLPLLALASCGQNAASGGRAKADPPAAGSAQPQAAVQKPTRGFAAIPVVAVAVRVGPLASGNNTAATVAPLTQSAVASQVAGVVARVVHLAGDWVKEGAPVVALDSSQLALAVSNAQVSLENAKINYQIGVDNASQDNPKLAFQVQSAQSALQSAQKNYDSQKALADIGGAPASAVDTARSQLEQAQANLEAARSALDQNKKSGTQTLAQLKLAIDMAQNQLQMAQLNLQYAMIKAPFTGQIAAVNVNPGVYVSTNTAVFVIVSAEREINFNVPPSDAPNLPLGSVVQFTYQGKSIPVKVSQSPSAPINGVVPMVAAAPRGFALPFGAVGTVTYSLTLARGAIVPIASLMTNEDQNYVYAVEGGKALMKYVKILGQSGTAAAVSGVDDGAQIILNPPPGLLAGSSVQIAGMAPSTAAPGDASVVPPAVGAQGAGAKGSGAQGGSKTGAGGGG
jgi:multidrug resistance efflux pump